MNGKRCAGVLTGRIGGTCLCRTRLITSISPTALLFSGLKLFGHLVVVPGICSYDTFENMSVHRLAKCWKTADGSLAVPRCVGKTV
jgi:hypothetical protein